MVEIGAVQSIGMKTMWVLITTLGGLFVVGTIGAVAYLFMLNKQYMKYTVYIFKRQKDNEGNYLPIFVGKDQARIKKDKKIKRWVFHVRKANIDLGEEEGFETRDENRQLNVPSMPSEKGGEVVFLEKLAPRKYAFMEPIDIEGEVKVRVSEADIAEALRVYDVNTKLFSKNNQALWTFAIYVTFGVLIMILIAYTLNKFEVLSDVASRLENVARILVQPTQAAVPSAAPG